MLRAILPLLALALAAAPAPAAAADVRACGTSMTVRADAASFTDAGQDAGAARLERLAGEVAALFQAQAALLCEAGFLGAQDFVGVEALLVQNGEGATEPLLYRPAKPAGTLVFQFAFGAGGAPDAAAVEQALRCWRRPDVEGCYED